MHIRPIRKEDAPYLNSIRLLPGVREGTLALPSERLESTQKWLDNMSADEHHFVAEIDGEVVGVAGITLGKGRMRHVAKLGIMVHDDHWGKGIGSALMEALVDLCDRWLNVVRIELIVNADNERAINLYRKFGFVEEGRQAKAVFKNGEYADLIMMARVR